MAKSSSKQQKVKVTWLAPENVYVAAKECADSIGQSLSQFITFAVAQRARRWTDPLTGQAVVGQGGRATQRMADAPYAGWTCWHSYHPGTPAAECARKAPAHHRREWTMTLPDGTERIDYDKWLSEQEEAG